MKIFGLPVNALVPYDLFATFSSRWLPSCNQLANLSMSKGRLLKHAVSWMKTNNSPLSVKIMAKR